MNCKVQCKLPRRPTMVSVISKIKNSIIRIEGAVNRIIVPGRGYNRLDLQENNRRLLYNKYSIGTQND